MPGSTCRRRGCAPASGAVGKLQQRPSVCSMKRPRRGCGEDEVSPGYARAVHPVHFVLAMMTKGGECTRDDTVSIRRGGKAMRAAQEQLCRVPRSAGGGMAMVSSRGCQSISSRSHLRRSAMNRRRRELQVARAGGYAAIDGATHGGQHQMSSSTSTWRGRCPGQYRLAMTSTWVAAASVQSASWPSKWVLMN